MIYNVLWFIWVLDMATGFAVVFYAHDFTEKYLEELHTINMARSTLLNYQRIQT